MIFSKFNGPWTQDQKGRENPWEKYLEQDESQEAVALNLAQLYKCTGKILLSPHSMFKFLGNKFFFKKSISIS